MFGFLSSWFLGQSWPKISCTKTQTLPNLRLPQGHVKCRRIPFPKVIKIYFTWIVFSPWRTMCRRGSDLVITDIRSRLTCHRCFASASAILMIRFAIKSPFCANHSGRLWRGRAAVQACMATRNLVGITTNTNRSSPCHFSGKTLSCQKRGLCS